MTGARDLCQPLRVILFRLVNLHFKRGTRMLGIEPNAIVLTVAQFVDKPWASLAQSR